MQIVIEIPEHIYHRIKTSDGRYRDAVRVHDAVKVGTPLPKHHGRLIDADAYRGAWFNSRQFEPMLLLDSAPTVIEADKEEE